MVRVYSVIHSENLVIKSHLKLPERFNENFELNKKYYASKLLTLPHFAWSFFFLPASPINSMLFSWYVQNIATSSLHWPTAHDKYQFETTTTDTTA